jgi:AcrR family transcriptional regulator
LTSFKELCELAGINRGTFYSHYSDIYNLLDEIQADMLANFQKSLEPLLTSNDKDITPLKITTGVFQCIKDNADICTVTLGPYGDKNFASRLISVGQKRCLETYSKSFVGATHKQIEFFYLFVSSGCIGLLQK